MMKATRLFRFLTFLTIPVAVGALFLIVDLALHPFEPSIGYQPFWTRWVYGSIFPIANIVIGALCIRRVRDNIIGPLLIIYGSGLTAQSIRAGFDPAFGALLFFVGGFLGWVGFFVLVLLFPNGKPHPHWMRWFLIVVLIIASGYGVFFPLGSPNFIYGADDAPNRLIENPFFLPTMVPIYQAFLGIMSAILLPVFIILLPLSVFLRYRAAGHQERAQIRWILWGVLVMMLAAIVQRILVALELPGLGNTVSAISTTLVFTLPALAVSNAILRHKLYDIDIIIRRTLIYSVLTGILAIVYFGAIILTQQLFRAATGETPDIAIVISTLLIAGLFSPIRRRVQNVIDRRLYRRKYDVENTLAGFQQTLRDEVDMETLKANLVGVVSGTMQPNRIALWVRDSTTK
ncbi:MAG: hypothetical protein KME04_04300 [Pleurocapsa minor GSE-CHR-MK-17-07R]|jgi:hypothetical protein|nr:hypothetical protein [Pleurocapsa minor GSE-CHR-MK 17-07R]